MKKYLIIIILSVTVSQMSSAQRYAYVDTEYILKNLSSYSSAQKELDRFSKQYQTEIESRYEGLDRLIKAYQAEKVLLTEELRKEREAEILRKETEVKELQKQRFGIDGDLFQKRQELIQPIQEEIYNAIKEVAQGGGFSVIFDKANESNILYADPRYDKSDRVLARLGVSAKDQSDGSEGSEDAQDDKSDNPDDTGKDSGRDGGTTTPPRNTPRDTGGGRK
jgi:outer membrane protein